MNVDSRINDNPYASPHSTGPNLDGVLFIPDRPALEAYCEARRMLYRRLRLVGQLEGTIEWDARSPIEAIRVGKRQVLCTVPFWYTPRFDFVINAEEQRFPATVEVRLTRILPILVRRFRLRVDGKTVYQEGRWPNENAEDIAIAVRPRRPR